MNHEISNNRTSVLKEDDEHDTSLIAHLGRKEIRSRSKQRYRGRSRSNNRNVSFSPRDKKEGYSDRRYGLDKPSYVCSFCKRRGHTRKFCYKLHGRDRYRAEVKFLGSPKENATEGSVENFKRSKHDKEEEDDDDDDMSCMMISAVNYINEPCYVDVLVENRSIQMEIDSGSAETVISEALFLKSFSQNKLLPCNKNLAVIDGKRLKVLGRLSVSVEFKGKRQQLYLIVLRCDNNFIPLMGRTWLDCLCAGWRNNFSLRIQERKVHKIGMEDYIDELKNFTRWQNCNGTQATARSAH
ncbi:uncharacterized protein LOC131430756 [Malaya genurostris]|uniref:uncharacterized protein LOC131430756 n=1 Tax=Malaya genurostris TaxID=325434 RepID=UPI0026F3E863|nr:uncharacterized protein LOC131430756 [Malaya genurostris]